MRFLATLAFTILAATGALRADDWPNWRGPTQSGVATGKGYPVKWSSTENVAWKIDLPGKGASTPVVWKDRIVVTCGIEGKNGVLCFDRAGKKLWQQTIGSEKPGKNAKASGANSSACTDGSHWFVYFKSGDLACLDLAGKILWQHNLQEMYGEDTLWWDVGTSPVLTKNAVVAAVIQSGPSYLVAFDKKSGEVSWKHDRMLNAPSEAAQSYTTPVVLERDGKETLIVLGADHVTAHDATNGDELWRVGGLNPRGEMYFRSIASPVVADEIVIAPYARGRTLTGIRLGGSGDVTGSHVLWTKPLGADVPTPAVLDGKVYNCSDRGDVSCIDSKTGETLWTGLVERHRTQYSSSPIIAGGHIYVTREDGKTFVLALGDKFSVVSANTLDNEQTVATPVFVDGMILLRSAEHLYCLRTSGSAPAGD
jgi:outer membrane protein assembly factor BamB